jgi:Fe-S cluster assembly iron-binding protein IscA
MLQVTHAAATQLADVRRAQGIPDTFGIRVFEQSGAGGEVMLGLQFAEDPSADDVVTEQEGTWVFVAPEVADRLATSALDVEHTAEGATLVVTPQDSDAGD